MLVQVLLLLEAIAATSFRSVVPPVTLELRTTPELHLARVGPVTLLTRAAPLPLPSRVSPAPVTAAAAAALADDVEFELSRDTEPASFVLGGLTESRPLIPRVLCPKPFALLALVTPSPSTPVPPTLNLLLPFEVSLPLPPPTLPVSLRAVDLRPTIPPAARALNIRAAPAAARARADASPAKDERQIPRFLTGEAVLSLRADGDGSPLPSFRSPSTAQISENGTPLPLCSHRVSVFALILAESVSLRRSTGKLLVGATAEVAESLFLVPVGEVVVGDDLVARPRPGGDTLRRSRLAGEILMALAETLAFMSIGAHSRCDAIT